MMGVKGIAPSTLDRFLKEMEIVKGESAESWREIQHGLQITVTNPESKWHRLVVIQYTKTRTVVFCGEARKAERATAELRHYSKHNSLRRQHTAVFDWSAPPRSATGSKRRRTETGTTGKEEEEPHPPPPPPPTPPPPHSAPLYGAAEATTRAQTDAIRKSGPRYNGDVAGDGPAVQGVSRPTNASNEGEGIEDGDITEEEDEPPVRKSPRKGNRARKVQDNERQKEDNKRQKEDAARQAARRVSRRESKNEENELWEIECILKHRKRSKGNGILYHIKWRGHTDEENSWEEHTATEKAERAVHEYWKNSGKQPPIFIRRQFDWPADWSSHAPSPHDSEHDSESENSRNRADSVNIENDDDPDADSSDNQDTENNEPAVNRVMRDEEGKETNIRPLANPAPPSRRRGARPQNSREQQKSIKEANQAGRQRGETEHQQQQQQQRQHNANSHLTEVYNGIDKVPETEEEIQKVLLPRIAKMYLESRALNRLPMSRLWHSEMTQRWTSGLRDAAVLINDLLDKYQQDQDQLSLLHAMLLYLSLPSRVLVPASRLKTPHRKFSVIVEATRETEGWKFEVEVGSDNNHNNNNRHNKPPSEGDMDRSNRNASDPSTGSTRGDKQIKQIVQLIRQGKTKTARQVLKSHGVAPGDPLTAKTMRDMHLDYGKGIVPIEEKGPQFQVSGVEITTLLNKHSTRDEESVGPFGWNRQMLKGTRRRTGEHAPSVVIGRLAATLTSEGLPKAIAFLMTTGGLTALNKIAAADNVARIARGEKPEVRPVNGGVYLLKTVLKAAAASTSGVRVTRSLNCTHSLRDRDAGSGGNDGPHGQPDQLVHLERRR